jgi:diacylglycerol O-acyltransferase / wax synthase
VNARPGRLDRVTPLDASNLRVEEHGLPMHVAALAILDGAPLLDPAGRPRMDDIRAGIERRLHLAPRLRQVLWRPHWGAGPPAWADAPRFDIRDHVRTRSVPAPGDEAALLAVCSQLNEPPLDRSRPLWEVWLLTGLAGGTVGLFIRLHHVVADGTAALPLLGVMFDAVPDAPRQAGGSSWVPRPMPGGQELLADSLRGQAGGLARFLAGFLAGAGRPGRLADHARARVRQARYLARLGLAPRVSLNRPVGRHHRLQLVRSDLDRVKAAAHAHGATVNDLVLAAVAAGARRLLESRGELTPGLVLTASVAVSLRPAAGQGGTGNRTGVLLVPLPAGEPDLARGLRQIAAATAEAKRLPPFQPGGRFTQRWMVRAMHRQRLVNLLVSNLPGPPLVLYFAGAQVREVFQAGVVQGNVTLSVGVLSYAGQLNFGIVADAGAVPDAAVFASGLSGALRELTAGP